MAQSLIILLLYNAQYTPKFNPLFGSLITLNIYGYTLTALPTVHTSREEAAEAAATDHASFLHAMYVATIIIVVVIE